MSNVHSLAAELLIRHVVIACRQITRQLLALASFLQWFNIFGLIYAFVPKQLIHYVYVTWLADMFRLFRLQPAHKSLTLATPVPSYGHFIAVITHLYSGHVVTFKRVAIAVVVPWAVHDLCVCAYLCVQ